MLQMYVDSKWLGWVGPCRTALLRWLYNRVAPLPLQSRVGWTKTIAGLARRPSNCTAAQHTPLQLSRCFRCQPMQMYIDSKWFGQAPDGDQYVAKLLRESLEELFHRFKVSFTAA